MIRATIPTLDEPTRTPRLTRNGELGMGCLLKQGAMVPLIQHESGSQAVAFLEPDRAACGLRLKVILEFGEDWEWA